MPLKRPATELLLAAAGFGCRTTPLEPVSQSLLGRWRLAAVRLSPTGEQLRTLVFNADGHYVVASDTRGVYPSLPADSVGSYSREYGRYALAGSVLHFDRDSIRSWDFLGGSYLHVGPVGQTVEGPNTDPTVELTPTRLTLRYFVDPGNGYFQVMDSYRRDP